MANKLLPYLVNAGFVFWNSPVICIPCASDGRQLNTSSGLSAIRLRLMMRRVCVRIQSSRTSHLEHSTASCPAFLSDGSEETRRRRQPVDPDGLSAGQVVTSAIFTSFQCGPPTHTDTHRQTDRRTHRQSDRQTGRQACSVGPSPVSYCSILRRIITSRVACDIHAVEMRTILGDRPTKPLRKQERTGTTVSRLQSGSDS